MGEGRRRRRRGGRRTRLVKSVREVRMEGMSLSEFGLQEMSREAREVKRGRDPSRVSEGRAEVQLSWRETREEMAGESARARNPEGPEEFRWGTVQRWAVLQFGMREEERREEKREREEEDLFQSRRD